jgi:hypothetical protein
MSTHSHGTPAWLKAAGLALGGVGLIAACSSGTTASSTGTAKPATTAPSTPAVTSPSSPSTASPTTTGPTTPVSPTSTPTATATLSAAACQHVKSLRGSLASLTSVPLNSSSASTITKDLGNIETQLKALKGEPALGSAVSQLSSSLNQVKRAAAGLGTSPTAAQAQHVVKSLAVLKGKAANASAKLSAACPKS